MATYLVEKLSRCHSWILHITWITFLFAKPRDHRADACRDSAGYIKGGRVPGREDSQLEMGGTLG